jgi:hypothetical protein
MEDFWEGSSGNCDEPTPRKRKRKKDPQGRIDPRLDVLGWKLRAGVELPLNQPYRTEEEETSAGPSRLRPLAGTQDRGLNRG